MKKVCSFILCFAFLFALSCPAFATSGQEEPLDLREYYLDMGLPQDFIDQRTDEQLQRLYNKSNGQMLQFAGTETSYLTETVGDATPYGTIPSEDMELSISILNEIGEDRYGNNTIEAVYVYVFYQWANGHPYVRHDDAITVNWDEDVFVYGEDFYHSAYNAYPGNEFEYDFEDEIAVSNQGGIGYYTSLGGLIGGTPAGNTEFTLYPKTGPLYPAGTYTPGMFRHSLNVQYVHDTRILGGSITFNYKDFGVSINMPEGSDSQADTYIGHFTYTQPD